MAAKVEADLVEFRKLQAVMDAYLGSDPGNPVHALYR